jgi:hypothetical protein
MFMHKWGGKTISLKTQMTGFDHLKLYHKLPSHTVKSLLWFCVSCIYSTLNVSV